MRTVLTAHREMQVLKVPPARMALRAHRAMRDRRDLQVQRALMALQAHRARPDRPVLRVHKGIQVLRGQPAQMGRSAQPVRRGHREPQKASPCSRTRTEGGSVAARAVVRLRRETPGSLVN